MSENSINIPTAKHIPGYPYPWPYVIVADDAFPLKTYMMKPYAFRGLSREERIFNYSLSLARRVVENAFGILASMFPVLLTTTNLSPELMQNVVLACCTLHNFLKEKKSANYAPHGFLDEIMPDVEVREGTWRQ